jgi:alpha,alpha-trehalase
VDGRPRYEGVRSFLASRQLELPLGDLADAPNAETICGLGNKKNLLFLQHIRERGVQVYESTIDFIRALRAHGVRTGLITSSKNCVEVLAGAGIGDLFDVRIDGHEHLRMKLRGKPAPDALLEAARRLGAAPSRAVVVDDVVSGVKAGSAGGFSLVLGVARQNDAPELLSHGAHVAVHDLAEVALTPSPAREIDSLPNALEHFDAVLARVGDRRIAVFLDYDGTLAPIASRPEDAVLTDTIRATVGRLAERCPVAILSGRDLSDLRRQVQLDHLWYAGCHGHDIAGPGGVERANDQAAAHHSEVGKAEAVLRDQLAGVPGVLFERKRFGLAVHWRNVPEPRVREVIASVKATVAAFPRLCSQPGRKVADIVPNIDWHKGLALRWLEEAMGLKEQDSLSLFVGDDATDEHAFRELADRGLAILVRGGLDRTIAHFRLDTTAEVQKFLAALAKARSDSPG